jgi:hypothetical protein
VAAPGPAHLSTTFMLWATGWAWITTTLVIGLDLIVDWAFSRVFVCFYFMLCLIVPFVLFSSCIQIYVLQNIIFPIQVELYQL